eukprot:229643_1
MAEAQNVATYARIRPYNSAINESKHLTARAEKKDNTILNRNKGDASNEDSYSFTRVFDMKDSTIDVFNEAIKPLLDEQILNGVNSIFIVYGQTGSGKSYTLIGEESHWGVLPMALKYLLTDCKAREKVTRIDVSAIEAYGVRTVKVGLYDLVQQLQIKRKKKKKGKSFNPYQTEDSSGRVNVSLDSNESTAKRKEITPKNCFRVITNLQEVSHMAPTLKNPHSSRGHTVYFCRIQMVDTEDVYFIAVDLAGSEGQNALGTPSEFEDGVKAVIRRNAPTRSIRNKQLANIRRAYKDRGMEAACIKDGLTELQKLFEQLVNGNLQNAKGSGLRRLLSTFVSLESAYAILFTLSASQNNRKTTKRTLEFANQCKLVKLTVQKVKEKIDKDAIIKQLQDTIKQLKGTIAQLQNAQPIESNVDQNTLSQLSQCESLTRQLSEAQEEEAKWNVGDYMCNLATNETELRKIFDKFDEDNNGALDRAEVQHALKASGQHKTKEQMDQLFAQFAQNDDDRIDFDEFLRMVSNSSFIEAFQSKMSSRIQQMMDNMEYLEDIDPGEDRDDDKDEEKEVYAETLNGMRKEDEAEAGSGPTIQAAHQRGNSKWQQFAREVTEFITIVYSHLELMRNQDEAINAKIRSSELSKCLVEAKEIALKREREVLNSIMSIPALTELFGDIIRIENLFNKLYDEYKEEQQLARAKIANGTITKYENAQKPESDVSSFVELLFAPRYLYFDRFQKWLEAIQDECEKRGIDPDHYECSKAKGKRIERAFYKAFYVYNDDLDHGFKRMTDVLRCSFVFGNFEDLYECFNVIDKLSSDNGGILRCKDRFNDNDVAFGYRDLLLNVYCPESRIVCEIQLHHNAFYQFKDHSHGIYKKARLFGEKGENKAYKYADKHMREGIGGEAYSVPVTPVDDNLVPSKHKKKQKQVAFAPIARDIDVTPLYDDESPLMSLPLQRWFHHNVHNITTHYKLVYRAMFVDFGFDDLTTVKGMTKDDLEEIGIDNSKHRQSIFFAICELNK